METVHLEARRVVCLKQSVHYRPVPLCHILQLCMALP
jgi:hypothetical protein